MLRRKNVKEVRLLGYLEQKELQHLLAASKAGDKSAIKKALCVVRRKSAETRHQWATYVNSAAFTREVYRQGSPSMTEMLPIIDRYSGDNKMPCAIVFKNGSVRFEDL